MAREFKTGATDENNFSPTSSFASARMLLTFALIYNLAMTALDVKDACLMVPHGSENGRAVLIPTGF